jgi:hypothetical protein
MTQFSTIFGNISFLIQTPPHSKTISAHPCFGEYNMIGYFAANRAVLGLISFHHFISPSETLHRKSKGASIASIASTIWGQFCSPFSSLLVTLVTPVSLCAKVSTVLSLLGGAVSNNLS